MKDNTWYTEIAPKVKTALMTILPMNLKQKYPATYDSKFKNLYVTDSDYELKDADFPNVFLETLPFVEEGTDLTADSVNGVLASFQISVATNTSQSDANDVCAEVVSVMKQMNFIVNSFPQFRNGDGVYRAIMRCRRVIGADDTLTLS